MDKQKQVDYKSIGRLRRYISDRSRVESSRRTGTCARHQRMLRRAILRARHLALLPMAPGHLRTTAPVSTDGHGRARAAEGEHDPESRETVPAGEGAEREAAPASAAPESAAPSDKAGSSPAEDRPGGSGQGAADVAPEPGAGAGEPASADAAPKGADAPSGPDDESASLSEEAPAPARADESSPPDAPTAGAEEPAGPEQQDGSGKVEAGESEVTAADVEQENEKT